MVWYLGISLVANIFLWFVVVMCWKYNKNVTMKDNTKFYVLVTILILIICGIYYIYSLCNRNTIYISDYATYYTLQCGQVTGFGQDWIEQLKSVIKGIWRNDYNSFLCIWGGLWFVLCPIKSVEAYIFETFLWAMIPTVFLIANYIKYIISLMEVKRPKTVFAIAMSAICFFPLLHATLLQGMPDVFGLFWVFAIINIIFRYDMKKIEWDKNILLVLCSVALFITRRWYAFWVVGFYMAFLLFKIYRGLKEYHSLKVYSGAIIALALSGGGTALVCLFPLFANILTNNYARSYSAYKHGGLLWEICNQIEYVGIVFAILMIVGLIIGIYKTKLRFMTLTLASTWLFVVFLFTRIQNADVHHTLLFFATYAYFIVIVIAGIDLIDVGKIRVAGHVLISLIVSLNCFQAITQVYDTPLFTNLSLAPPVRDNVEEIRQINTYIKTELIKDDETIIYIVPHDATYRPHVFSNAYIPGELQDNIPYGAGVIGAHAFPVEFLEAEYIMTSDPSGVNESKETIVKSLNQCLDYMVEQDIVREIKRFTHIKGIEFIFYERISDIHVEDIDVFIGCFDKLSEEFPELYHDVLEDYKSELEY